MQYLGSGSAEIDILHPSAFSLHPLALLLNASLPFLSDYVLLGQVAVGETGLVRFPGIE